MIAVGIVSTIGTLLLLAGINRLLTRRRHPSSRRAKWEANVAIDSSQALDRVRSALETLELASGPGVAGSTIEAELSADWRTRGNHVFVRVEPREHGTHVAISSWPKSRQLFDWGRSKRIVNVLGASLDPYRDVT